MLPTIARPAADVLADLQALRKQDPPTHGGRVLSYVYDPGIDGLDDLIAAATTAFLPVNGLDPTTFTSVATLERDIVAFARDIAGGDGDVVGSVTSGGTESCMLAVKSARTMWRAEHGSSADVDHTLPPTIVAPVTAHAAFHKAADYFDLELVPVGIDPATGNVSASDLLAVVDDLIAAGRPPAIVVLSAPNYPYGTIDPIDQLAPALAGRGVRVHVDACIGGFVLPFWPEDVPAWDFAVTGVTSISMDAHKYGYAPKGASVILYRGRANHHAQYFATVSWPGYPIVNPTMLGSRSATALAAAWAIINRLGTQGFYDAVERIYSATIAIQDAFAQIPGLRLLGEPVGMLLAVAAEEGPGAVDPFRFIDALTERGFLAQAQPAFGDNLPRTAHLSITPVTATIVSELCEAIAAAAAEVQGQPGARPNPALVERIAAEGLPTEVSDVMATLETLPTEMVPGALIEVLAAVIDPDRG